MTHDCEAVRDRLFDLAEGQLPAAERSRVERELQGCERCREDLASIRALHRAAAGWVDEPAPAEVRRGLPGSFAAPARAPSGWHDPWRWVPTAAAVLLGVLLLVDVRIVPTEGGLLLTAGRPQVPAPASLPETAPAEPSSVQGFLRDDGAPVAEAALRPASYFGSADRSGVYGSDGYGGDPYGPYAGSSARSGSGDGSRLLVALLREELERRDDLAEQAIGRLLQLQLRQQQQLNELARRLRTLDTTPTLPADPAPGTIRITTEPEGAPL
jgi:hypothetical protein